MQVVVGTGEGVGDRREVGVMCVLVIALLLAMAGSPGEGGCRVGHGSGICLD